MVFLNECNCIFDEELLEKAVDTYCRRNNVYCHKEYRITIHNTYPTIVISRKHLYVHDLLRTILFHVWSISSTSWVQLANKATALAIKYFFII